MTAAASALLGANYHGKDRVRVAKVRRGTDGVHQFAEFLVRIELTGGTEASYTHGDNRMVVATDTCKNHVYMLAKTHDCATPEQFGLDLALTFLKNYSHVKVAAIAITETPWKRVILDGSAHKHGFVKHAEGSRVARAVATRVPGRQVPDVQVTTTLRGIDLLKTTQSGWSDFHDSRFTTLPDTQERILATSINATWAYCEPAYCAPKIDYADVFLRVQAAIMKTFYGPTDTGEFSPGVQASLFKMATASIAAAPEIARITLNLPNLHFLPANLPVFARNGITFEHDVYVPSTEPHGIISATVERPGLAKL